MRSKLFYSTLAYALGGTMLFLVISGTAFSQSTIVTYNPRHPGISTVDQERTNTATPGNALQKASTVTIPQAFVKPTIDGVLSTGEWTDAVAFNLLTVVTPGGVVYMKNDACYLYIAAEIACNPVYYGNSNMINIWLDVNRNGQWDYPADGNLALPAPGYLYPPDVAAWGYPNLGGDWATCSTCQLRFHYPWYTLGVVLPSNLITLRKTDVLPDKTFVEAQIDYTNLPIGLVQGVPFNMRIQSYSGYYTGGGSLQIQGQWPTISTSAYFSGPIPSELSDAQLTTVIAAGDFFDIGAVGVEDNPVFSSKAFVTGTTFNGFFEYTLNDPPPQVVNFRARFYGPFPNTANTYTYNGTYTATATSGIASVSVPVNVPIGFYRVEFEVDDPEVCGIEPRLGPNNVLILGPGQVPCSVYPGDVNVDGVVNYGDKKDLANYIHDANLNAGWLNGYYRLAPHYPDPMSEVEFIGQAAIPWATPEGCHMDTDGSGVVNSFDNIAIKVNWFKTHDVGIAPKNNGSIPAAFDLAQNFPNPFNPSTKVQYTLPERSRVSIVVTDMLGRTVETLADDVIEAGVHNALFTASAHTSGTFIAIMKATGEESGITYTKSIKMVLSK